MRMVKDSYRAVAAAAAIVAVFGSVTSVSAATGWQNRQTQGRCWAYTLPESTSAAVQRGPAYLSIQNYPAEGVRGSVAVVSGTDETAKGSVYVDVDGNRFEMLPFADAAFSQSGAPEAALIEAMKRGRELTVTWEADGRTVVDRYSLMGFTAAKAQADRDCR